MLRAIFFFLIVAIFSSTPAAHAETPSAGKWGLGLMLGNPTALTGKYWISPKYSVDAGLGFGPSNWTMLFGDFHWNLPGVFGSSTKFVSQLNGYVGIGAGFSTWSRTTFCNRWVCDSTRDSGTALFIRGPFGVEWLPGSPPLGVFLELAPFITLTPVTNSSIDLAVGIRYYF